MRSSALGRGVPFAHIERIRRRLECYASGQVNGSERIVPININPIEGRSQILSKGRAPTNPAATDASCKLFVYSISTMTRDGPLAMHIPFSIFLLYIP